MLELYVNSNDSESSGGMLAGSDSNDGLSTDTPTETIAQVIAANLEAIAAEDKVRINLAYADNQPIYGSGSERLDLSSVAFNETLEITAYNLPEDFDLLNPPDFGETSHTAWTYPLPWVSPIDIGHRTNGEVILTGLQIRDGKSEIFGPNPFYGVRIAHGNTHLVSCRCLYNTYGVFSYSGYATLTNCLMDHNRVGVVAFNESLMVFANNVIMNSSEIGLCVTGNARALVVTSPDLSSDSDTKPLSVLEIRTTEPRKYYTAVKVAHQSQFALDIDIPGFNPNIRMTGILRILRESDYDHEDYQGIILESQSLMAATRNVQFRTPGRQFSNLGISIGGEALTTENVATTEADDTIAVHRQFIVASEQGAVAIE